MGRVPVSTKVQTHLNQFDYTLVDPATRARRAGQVGEGMGTSCSSNEQCPPTRSPSPRWSSSSACKHGLRSRPSRGDRRLHALDARCALVRPVLLARARRRGDAGRRGRRAGRRATGRRRRGSRRPAPWISIGVLVALGVANLSRAAHAARRAGAPVGIRGRWLVERLARAEPPDGDRRDRRRVRAFLRHASATRCSSR